GTAPAIDRLVVVADDADIGFAGGPALGEEAQPEILRDVGVLVLVDEDVAEALMVFGEDVGVLAEDADVLEEQIAEVDGVERFEAPLVVGVELLAAAIGVNARFTGGDILGQEAAVLPVVHHAGELAGGPALL